MRPAMDYVHAPLKLRQTVGDVGGDRRDRRLQFHNHRAMLGWHLVVAGDQHPVGVIDTITNRSQQLRVGDASR